MPLKILPPPSEAAYWGISWLAVVLLKTWIGQDGLHLDSWNKWVQFLFCMCQPWSYLMKFMNHFSCYVSILMQNKEFLFRNTMHVNCWSMFTSLSFKPKGKVSASALQPMFLTNCIQRLSTWWVNGNLPQIGVKIKYIWNHLVIWI